MRDTCYRLFAGSLSERAPLAAWLQKNAEKGWIPSNRKGNLFYFRREQTEQTNPDVRRGHFEVLRVPRALRPESGTEEGRILMVHFQNAGWEPTLTAGGLLVFRSTRRTAQDPLTVEERKRITMRGYLSTVFPLLLVLFLCTGVSTIWLLHRGLSYAAMEGAQLFSLIFTSSFFLLSLLLGLMDAFFLWIDDGKKKRKRPSVDVMGKIGSLLFFLPAFFALAVSIWAVVACVCTGSLWFGGFLMLSIAGVLLILAMGDAAGEVRTVKRRILLTLPAECLAAAILLGALLPSLLQPQHRFKEGTEGSDSPVYADEMPLTLAMLGKETQNALYSRFCEEKTSGVYVMLTAYEESLAQDSTAMPAMQYAVWDLPSASSAIRFAREYYGRGTYYTYNDVEDPDFGAEIVMGAVITYNTNDKAYDYLLICGSRLVNLYVEFSLTAEQKAIIGEAFFGETEG